ncbi:MAG: hypothetical protein J3Q66DRAFT_425189 [Benniella sp.]|nr:MAG: hypothetical protein J3Q66DRAFT_425189 [Benniella sp.]
MWKCFGLSEQEVRNALEDAKDRFHKNTKQATNLTPEQCDKALSDAVNTLNQVKKKGHGSLKKDHILRGEIADACSKLKELQDLKDDKVQATLKFAEEWRSKIGLNIPDRILPQPSDLESIRSASNASRSSNDSWDIPNHDQIREPDSASISSGTGALDEDQSASSSPGSSRSDLSTPWIIQSDNDGGVPCMRQSTDNTTSIELNTHEESAGVNSIPLPKTEHSTENLNTDARRIFTKNIRPQNTDARYIFTKNVRPPNVDFKPPKVGERLSSISQLATCLVLLQETHSPGDIPDLPARIWFRDAMANTDEYGRFKWLAADVIRAFMKDEVKDAKVVAEVAYLAPVLEKDMFRDLLHEFYDGIDRSGLLYFYQLDGLAQLIRGAKSGYLEADDLYKILAILSKHLHDFSQQLPVQIYQFTLTASHVLDAVADAKVSVLNREKLHEAQSVYLDSLKESLDPHLVYQAAYAHQALNCVSGDGTLWQEAFRRTGDVIQGVSGLTSAMEEVDINGFIDGLKDIQRGDLRASPPKNSMAERAQRFLETLKGVPSFDRKTAWYPALRGADVLIREGKFVSFNKLVYEAPCRLDPAFQWGVCQRLGEIAANPSWDLDTRGSAVAFLGEIYRNDTEWGQQVRIKQWILNILVQLSNLPGIEMQAKIFLVNLKKDGNTKKRAIYRASMDIDPTGSLYPLKVVSHIPTSSILLDRAQEIRARILTEDDQVWSCAYSPNGKLFAVGLFNSNISIYKTSNWKRVGTLSGHTRNVSGVAFSPMSNLIASSSWDGTVRLWGAETGPTLYVMTGHTGGVYCIAYSPRRPQIASGGQDNTVRIWNAATGSCLRTLSGHNRTTSSVAYSRDGKQIASGSMDKTIRLWDVETGECVRVLQGHHGPVRGVTYSHHENRIVSASDDKTIRVWDADTEMCLSVLVDYDAWSVASSPIGHVLACGGVVKTVKLWNIVSESYRTLTGHSDQVRSVVFSPSGNQIASGSWDNTVRLWDVDY